MRNLWEKKSLSFETSIILTGSSILSTQKINQKLIRCESCASQLFKQTNKIVLSFPSDGNGSCVLLFFIFTLLSLNYSQLFNVGYVSKPKHILANPITEWLLFAPRWQIYECTHIYINITCSDWEWDCVQHRDMTNSNNVNRAKLRKLSIINMDSNYYINFVSQRAILSFQFCIPFLSLCHYLWHCVKYRRHYMYIMHEQRKQGERRGVIGVVRRRKGGKFVEDSENCQWF